MLCSWVCWWKVLLQMILSHMHERTLKRDKSDTNEIFVNRLIHYMCKLSHSGCYTNVHSATLWATQNLHIYF